MKTVETADKAQGREVGEASGELSHSVVAAGVEVSHKTGQVGKVSVHSTKMKKRRPMLNQAHQGLFSGRHEIQMTQIWVALLLHRLKWNLLLHHLLLPL